jgi:curved DNA-binding protein CbpA
MFKKVAEAYSVLSKQDKRDLYDKYGHAGLDPNYARSPATNGRSAQMPSNNFHDFDFEGFGGFGGMGGGSRGFGGFGGAQGFNDFTFERAQDIFKEAFGSDQDFFGHNDPFFGGGRSQPQKSKTLSGKIGTKQRRNDDFGQMDFFGGGGMGFRKDMFGGDPFMNDFNGFGRGHSGFGNQFSNMASHMNNIGGGGGGGHMTSVSTSTVIK